ncbi:unnamed protein product, partial [marine sediment metagenome]
MRFYQGIGAVSVMTLFYSLAGNPVNPGDNDSITFTTKHTIASNQTTNVSFSCVVNNSNGKGFYPLSTELINDLQVTDPYPMGSVEISPDDGYVYTTDVTNSFTYILYNVAPTGNILYSTITIPVN